MLLAMELVDRHRRIDPRILRVQRDPLPLVKGTAAFGNLEAVRRVGIVAEDDAVATASGVPYRPLRVLFGFLPLDAKRVGHDLLLFL